MNVLILVPSILIAIGDPVPLPTSVEDFLQPGTQPDDMIQMLDPLSSSNVPGLPRGLLARELP